MAAKNAPGRAGPADGASSAALVTTNPAETGNPAADREDDADALPPTAPGGGVVETGKQDVSTHQGHRSGSDAALRPSGYSRRPARLVSGCQARQRAPGMQGPRVTSAFGTCAKVVLCVRSFCLASRPASGHHRIPRGCPSMERGFCVSGPFNAAGSRGIRPSWQHRCHQRTEEGSSERSAGDRDRNISTGSGRP